VGVYRIGGGSMFLSLSEHTLRCCVYILGWVHGNLRIMYVHRKGWSQASTKERDDLAAAEVGFPRNAQGDFTPVPASSYSVHLMPGRGHANGGDVYASGDTSNTAFEDNDSRPSIEEEYDDVDTRRSIEHVENIPVSIALPEHDADAAVTVSKSNMRPSIAVNTPWGPVMNGSNALRKAFNPSGQDQVCILRTIYRCAEREGRDAMTVSLFCAALDYNDQYDAAKLLAPSPLSQQS
jgi:hypothetical protein